LDDITTRVARFARKERLFRRVNRVLVAVSGGPDSVAALLLLRELQPEFEFELVVSHFDHQLRPESGADLAWVRDLCDRLGVLCLTGEGDVRRAATEQHAGIEETARRMRYQFLAFVAGEKRAECIVTGHTADDQAETVLQHIIRGSGIRGIRGMLPSGPVPGASAQTLVRPLLCLRREDTLQVCRENGIEPLADASNQDLSFSRNRIRAEILPALRQLNPSVSGALLGLAESAREAFAPIDREAQSTQPRERSVIGSVFDATSIRSLPAEALTLVLEREAGFHKTGFEVNRTRLRNAASVLARGTGLVRFGETLLELSRGLVRVGPQLMPPQPVALREVNVPGVTIAHPWRLQVTTTAQPPPDGAVDLTVDSGAIRGALAVRSPLPGDRVPYRAGTRRLSDIYADARVPSWRRGGLVIVDSERVVAFVGEAPIPAQPLSDGPLVHIRISAAP